MGQNQGGTWTPPTIKFHYYFHVPHLVGHQKLDVPIAAIGSRYPLGHFLGSNVPKNRENHVFDFNFALDALTPTCYSSKWSGQDFLSHGRSYCQVRTLYYAGRQKISKKGAIFRNVLDYEITNLALVWLRLLQLRMGTSTKNMPNYQAF